MNGEHRVNHVRLFVPNLDCPSAPHRHDFQLGKGPCGRFVTNLCVRTDVAGLYIRQTSLSHEQSDDWEIDEFFYPHHLLRGQVKYTLRLAKE